MYKLTLTKDERRAIDWVGNRYGNGDHLYKVLMGHCSQDDWANEDWDYKGDITFIVPEHAAWAIAEIGEADDNLWPCFADELKDKMLMFVYGIV